MKFKFIDNNSMENLYSYFLHYNVYTQEWNAILRNDVNRYMNSDDIIIFSDKDINRLIEKIGSLEIVENI